MTDGVELWRGCCNAWECDEMGHMNVRFYLARAHEGLAGLLAAMGMEGALRQGAEATAIAMDHHVRFLREARAGAPLVMTGGVLTLQETDARLVQIIRHVGSGEIAAAIQTVVRHVAGREARAFPWSESTRRRAARLPTPPWASRSCRCPSSGARWASGWIRPCWTSSGPSSTMCSRALPTLTSPPSPAAMSCCASPR